MLGGRFCRLVGFVQDLFLSAVYFAGMKQLTKESFAVARSWLKTHGRPLEITLFEYRFEKGKTDAVLESLGGFQNTDGGYGRRLEPDHTDDASTVLNTTIALATHRLIQTPANHPQIVGAVGYLLSTYDSEKRAWPIRLPVAPGGDGPPWFIVESLDALMTAFGGCYINPTAEVVGYLHDYAEHVPADFLSRVTEDVASMVLAETRELSHHDLMCAAQLLGSSSLPVAFRDQLQAKLGVAMPAGIETDPKKWGGYVLRPTQIIDGPEHVLAKSLPQAAIDADLDYEIARQGDDGAWSPFWSWGEDSEGWPVAERAWKSVLTERMLRVLANFGSISG